jgi:hypothetical protein
MGLFLGCALRVLWIDHRPRLACAKPWLATLLALACLLPNLWWNFAHHLATLRHTTEISQLDRLLFHPLSLVYFVAAQFGVMGPLLIPALIMAASVCIPSSPCRCWACSSCSRCSRAHANWAAPAYVAVTVLAVTILLKCGHTRWLAWTIAVNLLLAVTLYHWHRMTRPSASSCARAPIPSRRCGAGTSPAGNWPSACAAPAAAP